MEWPNTCLGDIIDIKHGFAFKGEYFVDYETKNVLVTPGNFSIGGGFQINKAKFYDGPVPSDYILSPRDIVVTMTDLSKQADTLGYSALIPDRSVRFLHNQRVGKVVLKDPKADLNFVAWLMRMSSYRNHIVGSATGSTVKHTSPGRILSYQFGLPPITEQRRIAEVLSVLDDKIELNRLMNETLEASARALFRDWFVNFGPTRANAEGRPAYLAPDLWSLFPDRLGDNDVPAGWHVGSLADLMSISPKEPLKRDVIAPYLDMAALPTSGSTTELPIDRIYSSGTRFRNGDTLLARITPCLENGKTGYVQNLPEDTVGWGSTEFIVLRTKSAIPSAVSYLVARDDEFRRHAIQSMTGTSGRQRANADAVARYPAVVPDDDKLWQAFGTILDPIFNQIASNERESRTLAETRDTLLPKLMSGAIRVREAESAVAALC